MSRHSHSRRHHRSSRIKSLIPTRGVALSWCLEIFFAIWVVVAFVLIAKTNFSDVSREIGGDDSVAAANAGNSDDALAGSEQILLPPNLVLPNPETNPIVPPKWRERD